jgi:hypothetical protein
VTRDRSLILGNLVMKRAHTDDCMRHALLAIELLFTVGPTLRLGSSISCRVGCLGRSGKNKPIGGDELPTYFVHEYTVLMRRDLSLHHQ